MSSEDEVETGVQHPTLFRGGRVIDPETGLDAIRDVLVDHGRIAAVATTGELSNLEAQVRDVSGLVVAPGFIDVHSHTNALEGQWLQLHDGVTTVLELEIGALPVAAAARHARANGSATHVGFSASWAVARMQVLTGAEPRGRFADFQTHVGHQAWQRPASSAELAAILDLLDVQLHDGAIGIGVVAGYAPYFGHDEYLAVARLAAARGVPVFTHARDLTVTRPDTPVDGAEEIVRAACDSGARMHFCHVHSSAGRHVPQVLDLVSEAQRDGARLTIEAYPYGAGMTTVGAEFLSAEGLARRGLRARDVVHAATGERLSSLARLAELRREDPGALVLIDNLHESRPSDLSLMLDVLTHPGALIASDAMPLVASAGHPASWPVQDEARTHPRTAGTFTKAIRLLHRAAREDLTSVLARATILPAQLLEDAVPAMRRKGRVQVGCDADLVVFDPAAVTDRASYLRSTTPAAGMSYVMVAGELVIDDGVLLTEVRPGRWIASELRP